MATDVLILGGFTFTEFASPDRMPYGGKHQVIKHRFPGGDRDLDAMGPDDNDRTWNGILWGDDALSDMVLLKTMMDQGTETNFTWGIESRNCLITSFEAEVEKVTCVHYTITIMFSDSGGAGLGPLTSLTSQIVSDIGSALGALL